MVLSKNDLSHMNCCGDWWLTILHLHVGTGPSSVNKPILSIEHSNVTLGLLTLEGQRWLSLFPFRNRIQFFNQVFCSEVRVAA